MKGYLQIYKGSLENNDIIFEDPNLIVDGASEHVTDLFTYLSAPSSISSLVTLPNSVAGITAISLGSAQSSKSYNSEGVSGIKALESTPPVPTDTTLQPPVYEYGLSGPGRIGQFLNYLDFSGTYSDLSQPEILKYGCYIPSGGILSASGDVIASHTWTDIDTWGSRGMAVKSDGTLHGWGKFEQYPGEYILTNIPTGNNFSSINLGENHAVALTTQGQLISWGDDSYSQVSFTPSGLGFTKVATAYNCSLALDSSGYIRGWGKGNTADILGDIPDGSGYTHITQYGTAAAAIDASGYITIWGPSHLDSYWEDTPDTSGWTSVELGQVHGVALSGNGQVSGWGDSLSIYGTPSGEPASSFTAVEAGEFHNVALSSNGAIKTWGVNSSFGHITKTPDRLAFSKIAAGGDFNLTVSSGYEVSGWGNETYGGISDIPTRGYPATQYMYSGTLNDTSSINSEGYILESRVARASQTLNDASAGFVVSGIGDVSSTREVKYILTINHDEWAFLNKYYGGVGNIGLWTLDIGETLKKYPEGTPLNNIDLYNLADTSKNPVFKLFSKKVFLPGGLQLLDNTQDSALTIIWSIKF